MLQHFCSIEKKNGELLAKIVDHRRPNSSLMRQSRKRDVDTRVRTKRVSIFYLKHLPVARNEQ